MINERYFDENKEDTRTRCVCCREPVDPPSMQCFWGCRAAAAAFGLMGMAEAIRNRFCHWCECGDMVLHKDGCGRECWENELS